MFPKWWLQVLFLFFGMLVRWKAHLVWVSLSPLVCMEICTTRGGREKGVGHPRNPCAPVTENAREGCSPDFMFYQTGALQLNSGNGMLPLSVGVDLH